MSVPAGPIRADRLRRVALTLTLLGLFAAAPIAITWLTGRDFPSEPPTGLAVLSAAAFAAASILFIATGRNAGVVVALPAISIGALLDDPETMAMVLAITAPAAEVAGMRSFAEVRAATARALGSGPLRRPDRGPWLLDRIAVATALGSAVAIAGWAVSVVAFGAGDDPTTRTVLPAATEFPAVLGIGLALAVVAAVISFLTGRVPGVLMALPVVPAVWLDAPQRSEVVVMVLATACGLLAVLASPIPESDDRARVARSPR